MGLSNLKRRAMLERYRTQMKRYQSPASPTEVGSLKQSIDEETQLVTNGQYAGFNRNSGQHEFTVGEETISGQLIFNGSIPIGEKITLLNPTNAALSASYGSKRL